jgi:hypothetical protein
MSLYRTQQNPTLSSVTGLTPQQEQACILMASGDSLTAVARQLKINRSTLYEWQNNMAFKCYYNQQCQEHQQEVKNALLGLHKQAIDTLTDLLTTGSENTRLKAAMWLLERVISVEAGDTDIREVLKRQNTHPTIDLEDLNSSFDMIGYKRDLKLYGLSEE